MLARLLAIDLGQQHQRLAVVARADDIDQAQLAAERGDRRRARLEHRDDRERALERDRALELLGEPPPPPGLGIRRARDHRGRREVHDQHDVADGRDVARREHARLGAPARR